MRWQAAKLLRLVVVFYGRCPAAGGRGDTSL